VSFVAEEAEVITVILEDLIKEEKQVNLQVELQKKETPSKRREPKDKIFVFIPHT